MPPLSPARWDSPFIPNLPFAVAVGLLLSGGILAGSPGLDAPAAIGAFLNHSFPTEEPTGISEWTVQETFTGINIDLPMHLAPYPGTTKLLCVAKEGRIFLFEDNPAATVTETFLDLRNKVFTSSDSGMTWLVFHPEFGQAGSANRGFVYLTYKWKPAGGNGAEAYWRLSRFNVPDGTRAADPETEQILIQQYDRQQFHDAGCMAFIDGYLHISIGDEGGSNDQYNVGQKINERLFSGILRIDVDQKATSHPIRRQPTQRPMPSGWPDSFTANYMIPPDNPFNDVSGGNLEEFYAIGLRQPYRFSHDSVSGRTWIAESGQDAREEIDILMPGANYGWPFREGKIARPTGPQPPVIPSPVIGTLTEPVWDAAHGTDNCIIGGFVYRGSAHPALTGKYLSVDNVTSHIRAHDFDGTIATNQILTDMPSGSVYSGTSTIGSDAAGEPVFIKINGTGTRGRFFQLNEITANPASKAAWFRFEDQSPSNTSGYVSDNPENATINSIPGGIPLLADDNESTASANVSYQSGSGITPTGFPVNTNGVRMASGDADGRPGNQAGDLHTASKLGVLDDFTVEISFNPATGSLGGGYQTFIGLDGTTGTTPANDGEDGPALQPFRLMRWGRNDAAATLFPLSNGDLFLNVRTLHKTSGEWTTVPLKLLSNTDFTENQWYHLAIVGSVSAGTITVYRYDFETSTYNQLAQTTGYIGNLQSGVWTLGRGAFNGNSADWVADALFDEVRISDQALSSSRFLYGNDPYLAVIPAVDPPALLSQTGAFSDLTSLTPAAGVVPYDVNSPLWSDGAEKLRWIALPNDGVHDTPAERIFFQAEGNWNFPPGTVFIKHFEMPVDDADPSVIRRLETRFIVMPNTGEPYGVTYKWRTDGSDADLLADGESEVLDIATLAGGTRQQTWDYPSRNDCRVCHNGNSDYVLGVKTNQLNRDLTYPLTGRSANQLETLGSLGWFDSAFRADLIPWMLKSHHLAESGASLTDRVRSYLDSNCSQCHQPGGVRAYFDARYTTPIDEQGLINGALETSDASPADHIISPGDPDHSIMLLRLGALTEIQMPPIAKHVVDAAAVQLLTDWINSLPPGPSVSFFNPSPASGPFTLGVHFTQDVTGLSPGDFHITNGMVSDLTGSGADYALAISPAGFGEVTVKLPANSAFSGGLGNYASALFTQNIADQELVTWLKLDDASGNLAIDSSPAGNNSATLMGMESSDWTNGRFGGALSFDNTDERMTISNVIGADFSISFWMKSVTTFPLAEAASAGASIFYSDIGGQARDFIVAGTRDLAGTNRISFQTGQGAGFQNIVLHGLSSVNTGQWNHVVITRAQASGEMKIHVNGGLDGSVIGSTALLTQNPTISIGATPGSAAASYEGDLDEIRIFTRVISNQEILKLSEGPEPAPPFTQWAQDWFPGIYHLQDPDKDPEDDGITNFGEFAFGSDPLATDIIPVPLQRNADGSITVSYRSLKPAAGATYKVRVSEDLIEWFDATPNITGIHTQALPGTDYEWITITYVPPLEAGASEFFRIEASPE